VALSRAITEAAQARLTWIHGTREDVYPSFYSDIPAIAASGLNMPPARRRWSDIQSVPGGQTFEQDLAALVRRLSENGYPQVVMYPHSPEGAEASVVKIIVPGMQFSGNRI
jgi:ribosomal protein S12 methylthiotransferase accessory factor